MPFVLFYQHILMIHKGFFITFSYMNIILIMFTMTTHYPILFSTPLLFLCFYVFNVRDPMNQRRLLPGLWTL